MNTPNELREEFRRTFTEISYGCLECGGFLIEHNGEERSDLDEVEKWWLQKLTDQKSDLKLALRDRIKAKYGQCGLTDDLFALLDNL